MLWHYKKVNFDIDFRTKLIDGIAKSGKVEGGLWHAKNQKTSTGFQSWQMYPKDGLKREKLSKATGIPAQYGEPIDMFIKTKFSFNLYFYHVALERYVYSFLGSIVSKNIHYKVPF